LLLSPRSSATTPGVDWTPTAAGAYEIYAIIDPSNGIAETYENNNTVKRTITVLPAAPDVLAPHVDSFTINGGAPSATEMGVRLDTTASDPAPSSSIAKLLFMEYEFSVGANQWVPVRASAWLDYPTANTNHAWQVMPSSGMKYLQAWAADGAGNISIFPGKAYINFLPPTQRLAQNQTQIHRYNLSSGQQLTVRVEPVSGDPDLYIWAPDHSTRPPWVSNLRTGIDDITLTAPVAGIYQIEVYGFAATEYRLIVNITTAADTVNTAQANGGVDPTKPPPGQPRLSASNEPGSQIGLPTPGQVQQAIYLPLIRR